MKRLILILMFVLALPGLLHAQAVTGVLRAQSTACAIATECVVLNVNRNQSSGAAIQLVGTWVGTIVFEGTVDGATWASIGGSPATGGAVATSTTTTGIWQFGLGGLTGIRARPNAYTSGNIGTTIVGSSGNAGVPAAGVGGGTQSVNLAQLNGAGPITTLPVDTELPAAVLLADALALPTTPLVGAANLCYNGATLDLCRSSTGGSGTIDANTQRMVIATDDPLEAALIAHDAVDSGKSLKTGCKATTAVSGLTPVSDADRTDMRCDIRGALVSSPYVVLEDRIRAVLANTDGNSTQIVAAGGANITYCITSVTIANVSATNITVDIRDGTGGAVLWTYHSAANNGATHTHPTPYCGSANTALAIDGSAAVTTLTVSISGFKIRF